MVFDERKLKLKSLSYGFASQLNVCFNFSMKTPGRETCLNVIKKAVFICTGVQLYSLRSQSPGLTNIVNNHSTQAMKNSYLCKGTSFKIITSLLSTVLNSNTWEMIGIDGEAQPHSHASVSVTMTYKTSGSSLRFQNQFILFFHTQLHNTAFSSVTYTVA